jgi:hypothetical protein
MHGEGRRLLEESLRMDSTAEIKPQVLGIFCGCILF